MKLAPVLFAAALAAAEPRLPPGVTCGMIRDKVAEFGRARAIAYALDQGYSLWQIEEARKCLKR